jgi:endonuclease G
MLIDPCLVAASQARAARAGIVDRLQAQPGEAPRPASPTQREARFATILADTVNPDVARVQFERLLGANDLVGIAYLQRGLLCAHSVCRIHLRDRYSQTTGFGTGFLVAPGVLMTNHHVIGSAAEAAGGVAEFDYELDVAGRDRPVAEFPLLTDPAPIAVQSLDFCLAAVSPRSRDGRRSLAEFAWLPLDPTPGKAFVGEYLTIIQHPGGERKQVCVRENKLLRYEDADNTVWYQTDTVAGSSGSPAFNNSWQVVALHHSGVPKTDSQGRWLCVDGTPWNPSIDESHVAWIANEGIRVSRIVSFLADNQAGHPLAQLVLSRPVAPEGSSAQQSDGWQTGPSAVQDGELCVTIPIRVAVRVGAPPLPAAQPVALPLQRPGAVASLPPGPDVSGMEAVVVDQSNYGERRGYDPNFLGSRKLRVPLPKLSAALKKLAAPVKGRTDGELKYWNYSVVLNKARRLAFFAAGNVDAALRPAHAGRDGDRWYVDSRVAAKLQLDQSFYGGQREFEADRASNPFDRGHLVRRLDAQWDDDPARAARNGNDSFHFANCAPQHWQYNQGAKRWLGLEDYVISRFARGRRACVFNGPVFDAPLSTPGEDGRLAPRIDGQPHSDPTFGGVPIPKLFFKIVACPGQDGRLAVAAFLMSQEDLLRIMGDRLKGLPPTPDEVLTAAQAKLYQVSVSDVERLTGLDFGPLAAAGAAREALVPRGPRLIESLADVSV